MASAVATSVHQEKRFEDILQQNQNFEHYEKIFQEVLQDLESDEILEVFRSEYEKLHNAFLSSHDGEKRLIKKCSDLSAEISSCSLKVKSAIDLSKADKQTIDQLAKEIAKAQTKIKHSKEAEVTLKEKIKQLKMDIKELDNTLRKAPSAVIDQDTTVTELKRVKMELQKEHETQKGMLVGIQHEADHLEKRVAKVQEEKADMEKKLLDLKTSYDDQEKALNYQRERKHRKEEELKVLKTDMGARNLELTTQTEEIEAISKDIKENEADLAAIKKESEQINADLNNVIKQSQKSQQELDEVTSKTDDIKKDNAQLLQQLKIKESERNSLIKEKLKQEKLCDAIEKKNIALEQQRAEADADRVKLKFELKEAEDGNEKLSDKADNDRKQIEDLKRERDILNKNYLKSQSATQRQRDWLMVKENQSRNLEHQIRGFERHAERQRVVKHQLEKEVSNYENDATEAANHYVAVMEEIKEKEGLVVQRQKDIQDVEAKLRQQQTLLDNVLNERNLYAKNYLLLNQQIIELKRRFRGMQALIDNLKTEIKKKDDKLVHEERNVAEKTRKKGEHDQHIRNCKTITEKRDKMIDAYNEELHKLNQIIAEADAEKAKQRRDHVNVMNERDILGAQLIRRNDELAKLYENIRIQQSTLRKGEAQYEARLRDMQHLNFHIEQLKQELTAMRNFADRVPDLQKQINRAKRELGREECRVRTLLDECDNPRNVHRYRRLEGSEPQTQKLFERVRELQTELLEKTTEIDQKERLIAEREKMYVELKAIVARQPGPEVAEQLNVYQDSLQKKSGQMRAMKDSLKQFQEQTEHYKARFEELQGELREINADYMTQLKRHQQQQDRQRKINEMMGRRPDDNGDDGGNNKREDVYVGYTAPPRPQTSDGDGGAPLPTLVDDDQELAPGPPDDDDNDDDGLGFDPAGEDGAEDQGDFGDDDEDV